MGYKTTLDRVNYKTTLDRVNFRPNSLRTANSWLKLWSMGVKARMLCIFVGGVRKCRNIGSVEQGVVCPRYYSLYSKKRFVREVEQADLGIELRSCLNL